MALVMDDSALATRHLGLEEAPQAYEMFQRKKDGAIEIILQS